LFKNGRQIGEKGKRSQKSFKRWNNRAIRNTGFLKPEEEIFEAKKLVTESKQHEQTAGVRSRTDCETKAIQTVA